MAAVERTRRWPPRQRILITDTGRQACQVYAQTVSEARTAGIDPQTALKGWAEGLGIQATDGILLEELAREIRTLGDLARAVEACGINSNDVKAGLGRLYGADLIKPPDDTQKETVRPYR